MDINIKETPCSAIAKLLCETVDDFRMVLAPYYAELTATEMPERLLKLRIAALQEVHRCLAHYQELNYDAKLLCTIARKKGDMILKITTKAEAEKISRPRAPHYDGGKFVADEFIIPEEELICWSQASLNMGAPPNSVGFERFRELFCQVYPEKSKEMGL